MTVRSVAGTPRVPDEDLLAAARDGDEGAFRALVEPHRSELGAHCYRMLGSVHDAEDVLQEALLRIWRGLGRFEGRSSLRVWMYRIATNACLSTLERRERRVLPVAFAGAADPVELDETPALDRSWLAPYPHDAGLDDTRAAPEARYEQLESVELAFVAALQHLSPNERAVLLLREVLGFSAKEIADQLQTTTGAVTSVLQRARVRVDGRLPVPSQQEVQRSLGESGVRALIERYVDAMDRRDVDAVVGLLADDATWSMPPLVGWYRGRRSIAAFLERYPFRVRWRRLVARANGQPAVAGYLWDDERGCYRAWVLDVLTLRGNSIVAVVGFLGPEHLDRLGLPSELPA